MKNILRNTEIEYIKCFARCHEDGRIMRFQDNLLPDMYCHNFTYIKENVPRDEFGGIIAKELSIRKQGCKSFLQIEADSSIDKDAITNLFIVPEFSRHYFMAVSPEKFVLLKGNESCIIKQASTPETVEDCINVDISQNAGTMGSDFARRRILRKAKEYAASGNDLEAYVCYYKGIPVGNCELFIHGETAKIEDFGILEEYRRKGFGTSVLKYLLQRCANLGIKTAYVVTDADDTAKDMYSKCGFDIVGEETTLFAYI